MRTCNLAVILLLGLLLGGCSFMIEGQEEGRPCKDGRCPFGYACIEDRCETVENGSETERACTAVADCTCDDGTIAVCGEDERCRCMMLQGRIDGVGPEEGSGRFRLTGGRLGHSNCVSKGSDPTYVLCGGFSQ